MVRDTLATTAVQSAYELQCHLMSCLYLAYAYMGNEISYPLKPFIGADESRDLFWQRVIDLMSLMSAPMLRINQDPRFFTELFYELKSYSPTLVANNLTQTVGATPQLFRSNSTIDKQLQNKKSSLLSSSMISSSNTLQNTKKKSVQPPQQPQISNNLLPSSSSSLSYFVDPPSQFSNNSSNNNNRNGVVSGVKPNRLSVNIPSYHHPSIYNTRQQQLVNDENSNKNNYFSSSSQENSNIKVTKLMQPLIQLSTFTNNSKQQAPQAYDYSLIPSSQTTVVNLSKTKELEMAS
jgi:hypothetical protein